MRLVKCEKKNVESVKGYCVCKMQEIVKEFIDSGMDCAEIKDFTQKNATTCAASFNNACRRMKVNSVRAFAGENKCFVVRM